MSCTSHLGTYSLFTEFACAAKRLPSPSSLFQQSLPSHSGMCSHLQFLLQKIPLTTATCSSLSNGLVLWLKTKADKRPHVLPPTEVSRIPVLCTASQSCSAHPEPFLHQCDQGHVMKMPASLCRTQEGG